MSYFCLYFAFLRWVNIHVYTTVCNQVHFAYLPIRILLFSWWSQSVVQVRVHSASLTSLCGISSCFVFVNTALQFSQAALLIELLLGCSSLTCICPILQTGRLPPWCCSEPVPWQPWWPSWWPSFPYAKGHRDGTTAPWLCSCSLQVRLCHLFSS